MLSVTYAVVMCVCVCVRACVCVCVCHLIEIVRDFPRSGKGRLVWSDQVEHHPQSLEPSHVAAGTQCTEGRREHEHFHQLCVGYQAGASPGASHTYVHAEG